MKYSAPTYFRPTTCETCGKEFWAARRSAKYCSDGCKQFAYRQNKKRLDEARKLQQPLELQGG